MKYNIIFLLMISLRLFADTGLYCPQNHRYINLGMTFDQVIAACGKPLIEQKSKTPLYQKIPVQQLTYNNQGTRTAFYGVWNIPTGFSGSTLQVDIVDSKVKAINFNGGRNNAVSICNGANIQVGDPVANVYNACGTPSTINNTWTNVPIESEQKPIIWIYQPGPYQPRVSLTFINGKLQSIN